MVAEAQRKRDTDDRSRGFRPSVLVLHPDSAKRQHYEDILAPFAEVVGVATVDQAESVLCEQPVDVVVTSWFESVVDRLQRNRAGLVVIHCGDSLPDGVIEAAAQDHPVFHVEDPGALPQKLFEVLRPYRSPLARHRPIGLHIRWAGIDSLHPVLDLSNEGVAFAIDSGATEPLIGGTVLEGAEIRGVDIVAVQDVRLVVRHISQIDHDTFRIGCEMLRPVSPTLPGRRITDRAHRIALLRGALRTGSLTLEPMENPGSAIKDLTGRMDAAGDNLSLEGRSSHRLEVFDVVRGRFEAGGHLHTFVSSVSSAEPLAIRFPAALIETQQRLTVRHRLSGQPLRIRISTALAETPLFRVVRDVSAAGFSIAVDPEDDLLPVGTVLDVLIRASSEEFRCRAQVRNRTREHDGKVRCGVAFIGLSEETHQRLADFVLRSRFPGVEDGRAIPFDDLWRLFRETQFITDERDAALTPLLPAVRRTLQGLGSRPSDLWKSLVVRENDQLVGHVSCVRAYPRTWMSQHLSAVTGHRAAQLLNLGAAEFFSQNPDLEYFRIWYLRESNWPARVFGGFARRIADPELSVVRQVAHFSVATDWQPPPVSPSFSVVEATASDLAVIESHLLAREPALLIRAEGLLRSELDLSDLNGRFAKLGVRRQRRLLLALENDAPIGFALAEVSSPGLNLYEALSSFRIFVLAAGAHVGDEVRASLLSALLPIYRQSGRRLARGIIDPRDADSFRRLGIVLDDKQSMCWTAHRSIHQRFAEHVNRFFERLEARRHRHVKETHLG